MTEQQRKNLEQEISVMQAQIEGKPLQIRYMSELGEYSDWCDLDHPILKFDWQHNDYRVKEEELNLQQIGVLDAFEAGMPIETLSVKDGEKWIEISREFWTTKLIEDKMKYNKTKFRIKK